MSTELFQNIIILLLEIIHQLEIRQIYSIEVSAKLTLHIKLVGLSQD